MCSITAQTPSVEKGVHIKKYMDDELQRFKQQINLVEFSLSNGFLEIDKKRSSVNCTVLRGAAGRIGVSEDQDSNWIYYDFDSQKGGSIIDLVMMLNKCNLGFARKTLRSWTGTESDFNIEDYQKYFNPRKSNANRRKASIEFADSTILQSHNRFLDFRGFKTSTYNSDRFKETILTDSYNNILFPHQDKAGFYGFEKRNFEFHGYSEYGKRCLWFSNIRKTDKRYFFSESGLDCLAHYQLHNDGRTAYFSIGGQLSDSQLDLIEAVRVKNPDIELCSGFDNDSNGRKYAEKIQARIGSSRTSKEFPPDEGQDWNELLKKVS